MKRLKFGLWELPQNLLGAALLGVARASGGVPDWAIRSDGSGFGFPRAIGTLNPIL